MNLGKLQRDQELIKANVLGSMKHRPRFAGLGGGRVLPLGKRAMDHGEK